MKVFYKVHGEYDIGLEELIFSSKDDAWKIAKRNHDLQDVGIPFEECVNDGLYGLTELVVWEDKT